MMTLTKPQLSEFRSYLIGALEGHLLDEVENYISSAIEGSFTEEQLDSPELREILVNEADRIDYVWTNT